MESKFDFKEQNLIVIGKKAGEGITCGLVRESPSEESTLNNRASKGEKAPTGQKGCETWALPIRAQKVVNAQTALQGGNEEVRGKGRSGAT